MGGSGEPLHGPVGRWGEDDLLPISALQHVVFCERQAALIHVEQQWADNALTVEGTYLHSTVDEKAPNREVRGDLVVLRRVPLRSLRLGLVGRADVVELHRTVVGRGDGDGGAVSLPLSGLSGRWRPCPVEYKRGRPKRDACDEVQLCAQALCLEEMLGASIQRGALFYGARHRRLEVELGEQLRQTTVGAINRLRELVATGHTPPAVETAKCASCSLLSVCLPSAMAGGRSARRYLSELAAAISAEEGEP